MCDDGAGTLKQAFALILKFLLSLKERKIQSLTPIKSAAVHWL